MSRDTSRSSTLPSPKRNASPQPTRSRPPAHTASSSLRKPILRPFLLAEDYRGCLPLWLSRFTGYCPPGSNPPYDPLPFPPFSWLIYIPLKVEVWILASPAPSLASFSLKRSLLVFGVIESPLARPRNLVGGHFVAALLGTAITRLFVLDPRYQGYLDNTGFHTNTFVNGVPPMAVSLTIMLMLGVAHPPAGATALNATVLFSHRHSLLALPSRHHHLVHHHARLGTLHHNNLGRRRYPVYWWSAQGTFVLPGAEECMNDEERALRTLRENPLCLAEDGGRTEEALLE
ncbi:hypothetical protein EHS25_005538 [Saitozyma podzolica]|uniref:HPP transmembrane region domain-containing protein n=1 Tax=Saitozyma podzolica TaxID=1890683 RepID=A0A427XXN1_9TREE|nr:hypothetical protein EHS25_005538 [Saitozyma podzolica]